MRSSSYAVIGAMVVSSFVLARPVANALSTGPGAIYGACVLGLLLVALPAIAFRRHMDPSSWLAVAYLVYLGAILALQLLSPGKDPSVPLHGFAALSVPCLIYMVAQRARAPARAVAIDTLIAPLLAVSAAASILYFFFDFTFWGLIQHHVYTDAIYANDNIDRRAIGLLSSPQSHALSMVMLLLICMDRYRRMPMSTLLIALLAVAGGMLSGSKAFLLGALMIVALSLPLKLVIWFGVPLLGAAWAFAEGLAATGIRALSLVDAVQGVGEYTATPLWLAAFEFATDPTRLLWGLGLGVMGGVSEELEASPLEFTSTESYFLQILVEAGLVGVLLFLAFLVAALRQTARHGTPEAGVRPILLLAVLVNGVFTPALYGFGNAALIGLLLTHIRSNHR